MARLTAAQRNALPASDFAGPNRTFPIEDATHARAALSLKRFGPAKKIESKVRSKFPGIAVGGARGQAISNLQNRGK
jgi:hypothetical protein